MLTPLIRFEQAGNATPGVAGESRVDFQAGSIITATDDANPGGLETHLWTVVGPPGVVIVLSGENTDTVTFTPSVEGSYLVYKQYGSLYSWTTLSDGQRDSTQGGAAALYTNGTRALCPGETRQFDDVDGFAAELHPLFAVWDKLRLAGDAADEGTVWYTNDAGSLVPLAPGASGQFLQTTGPAATPVWATVIHSQSLDSAYNFGRSITADEGPVTITNPNADAINVLDLATTALGTGTALNITNLGDGDAIAWDRGRLLVPSNNDVNNPAIAFNTVAGHGIYANSSSHTYFPVGAVNRMSIGGYGIRVGQVGGASYSSTAPMVAHLVNNTSGLGFPAGDEVSLISNGLEAVRYDNAQNQILTGDLSIGTGVAATLGHLHINATATNVPCVYAELGAGTTGIRLAYSGSTSWVRIGGLAAPHPAVGKTAHGVLTTNRKVVFDTNGDAYANAGDPSFAFTTNHDVATLGVYATDHATLTADIQEWLTKDGVVLSKITTDGHLLVPDGSAGNASVALASNTGNGLFGTINDLSVTIGGVEQMQISTSVFKMNNPLKLREETGPTPLSSTYGQLWVKDDTPNTLWFTDDTGVSVKQLYAPAANEAAIDSNGLQAVRWDSVQNQINAGNIQLGAGQKLGLDDPGNAYIASDINGRIVHAINSTSRFELTSLLALIKTVPLEQRKSGIAETESLGLHVHNDTVATAVLAQYSPMLVLEGQGWDTNLLATSETKWAQQVRPVQEITAAPSSELVFKASVAGGVYVDALTLTSGGQVLIQDGSITDPSVALASATGSGMYGDATSLRFSLNGSQHLSIINNQVSVGSSAVRLNVGTGTALLPAIRNSGDADSGLFFDTIGHVAVTAAGVEAGRWDSSQNYIAAASILTQLTTGPMLVNEGATATNPTLIPNRQSASSGIGASSAGVVSTIAGTVEALRVDADTTAGNTRLMIYDVDNALLERVTVGASDSGGAGFKVLRIPN